jgi:hypothetical protein
MRLLKTLERAFGRYAIPNLSLCLVIGQVFVLLSSMLGLLDLDYFILVPDRVLQGEWWRLFTFVFHPPSPGLFGYALVAFSFYLFYLFGSALENFWGDFHYNLFLLIGYVLTVGTAFIVPSGAVSNAYIGGSVFLAFAYLEPDFVMYLFFILPVRIKWLALLTWIGYGLVLILGSWSLRLLVLASVGNFLLFFGREIVQSARSGRRRMATQARKFSEDDEGPRHRCHVCGKTDLTNPEMDFRYCSKCVGDECYCPEHLQNHVHVTVAKDAEAGR